MANKKITDLTELTAAASNDYLEIVDTSANTSKKISRENLIAGHDHGSLSGLGDNDHPQYLLSASTNYPRADGWIPVSDTWTYASATTVTVPTGAASIYTVGMGIRLTANSVVKQAYIVKVENTKLTVAGDALTDYPFSAISYAPNPATAIGFPVWFNYTPTYSQATLVTADGTFSMRYSVIGKTVFIRLRAWNCTLSSGGTHIGISLPITPRADPNVHSMNIFKGTPSVCSLDSANTVLNVFSSINLGSFTGSETNIDFSVDLTYEAV